MYVHSTSYTLFIVSVSFRALNFVCTYAFYTLFNVQPTPCSHAKCVVFHVSIHEGQKSEKFLNSFRSNSLLSVYYFLLLKEIRLSSWQTEKTCNLWWQVGKTKFSLQFDVLDLHDPQLYNWQLEFLESSMKSSIHKDFVMQQI